MCHTTGEVGVAGDLTAVVWFRLQPHCVDVPSPGTPANSFKSDLKWSLNVVRWTTLPFSATLKVASPTSVFATDKAASFMLQEK